MTNNRPLSYYLTPVLLVIGPALSLTGWYVRPDRTGAWASAAVAFLVLAVIWRATAVLSRRSPGHGHVVGPLRECIAVGAFVLVASLTVKLGSSMALIPDAELARRLANVIAGAALVMLGNSLPKTLTPLSALRCNGARIQAFQRFTGWSWVLTGLGYIVIWLLLPIGAAKPVSFLLLMSGIAVNVSQLVRLRWAHTKAA